MRVVRFLCVCARTRVNRLSHVCVRACVCARAVYDQYDDAWAAATLPPAHWAAVLHLALHAGARAKVRPYPRRPKP